MIVLAVWRYWEYVCMKKDIDDSKSDLRKNPVLRRAQIHVKVIYGSSKSNRTINYFLD